MATGLEAQQHASRASPRHAVHHHPGRQVSTALRLGLSTVLLGGVAGSMLLHLGFSPVLTGSMRGTFAPGALVLTRPMPVGDVRPGDIVVFRPPGHAEEYAHRVVTVTRPSVGTGPVITTKGDANAAPDNWRTPLVRTTVPQVIFSVPALGSLLVALRQPSRLMLLLAAIGITSLLALTAVGWLLRPPASRVVPAPTAPAPPHPHDPVVAGQPARALLKGFS